jgi:hypothetical protein
MRAIPFKIMLCFFICLLFMNWISSVGQHAYAAQAVEELVWGHQPTSAATKQTRWARDLEPRVSNTPSDVFRPTPGLVIGQHHGGRR